MVRDGPADDEPTPARRHRSVAELQHAPERSSIERLCDAIAPGSRPGSVRRLCGGLGSGMHRVQLYLPGGDRRAIVLRRYASPHLLAQPDACLREWQTLELVAAAGVAAPRPLWRDPEGAFFGVPALAMSAEPGRPLLAPSDVSRWASQLGATLARLHAAPLDNDDVSFLRWDHADEGTARRLAQPDHAPEVAGRLAAHPRAHALWATLQRCWPAYRPGQPVLLHGDYWTGNTLWLRGRLMSLVDWDHALLGDPCLDLCSCRLDLTQLYGLDAADLFLHAYSAAGGQPVLQLPLWDALVAWQSLPHWDRWLPPYHEMGRSDLSAAVQRSRLDTFIDASLAQLA